MPVNVQYKQSGVFRKILAHSTHITFLAANIFSVKKYVISSLDTYMYSWLIRYGLYDDFT